MRQCLLGITATLAIGASARACSIPVFRYALEHWQPDAIQVVVFLDGPPNNQTRAALTILEPDDLHAKYAGNLYVRRVNLSNEDDPRWIELWEAQQTTQLPWMVAFSPEKSVRKPILAGKLTEQLARSLLSSPKRSQLGKHLSAGDSAVWIFLRSGDKNDDDQALKLLKRELRRLENELELPKIDPADIAGDSVESVQEKLKLRFPIIELHHDDAKEKAFVQMLLNIEPREARRSERGPVAFPVFGRGRVLHSLAGAEINAEQIESDCVFLTSACQCTVKRDNPGIDLLTDTDWDTLVEPMIKLDDSVPTLVGLSGFADSFRKDTDSSLPNGSPIETPTENGPDRAENDEPAPQANEPAASKVEGVGGMAIQIVGCLAMAVFVLSVFFAPRK